MSCMWRKMEYVTPSYRTRDVANEQLSPMGHLWWHCGLTIDPPVMNGTSAENLWGTLSPPACFVAASLPFLRDLTAEPLIRWVTVRRIEEFCMPSGYG